MPEPTLQEIFGAGAAQDLTTITISKASLTGLTATADNRAESLLVGILLKAKSFLTPEAFDLNADQSVSIEESFESLINRRINEEQYRQKVLSVNLHKAEPTSVIDPDDY